MGAEPQPMALSPEQLNDTDEKILDVMQEGRVTPQHVADRLDLSRPYASDRLKRLVEHAHVERLAAGLYELVDDPREDVHEDGAGGAGEIPGEPGGYTDADLSIDDDQDIDVKVGATPEEAAKLKTRIENLEASREQIVDERDELRGRVEELEEQRRGDAIDVDRVQTALDDVEAAAERGNGQALQEALRRAREVLEDAE